MNRSNRYAIALTAFTLALSAQAQIDSTAPYIEPDPAVPIAIAPTVPSWLRTGVGVTLIGQLRLEQYLLPVDSDPAPAEIPLALSQ